MADTLTPYVACPLAGAVTGWTLIADGTIAATVGIEVAGSNAVRVAVTTSGTAPADASPDYIVLDELRSSIELPLSAANRVYGRGLARDSGVRMYQVGV